MAWGWRLDQSFAKEFPSSEAHFAAGPLFHQVHPCGAQPNPLQMGCDGKLAKAGFFKEGRPNSARSRSPSYLVSFITLLLRAPPVAS